VERRDIWSARDLKKTNVEWLRHMRSKMIEATVGLYPAIERDQLKLYVHCKKQMLHLDFIEAMAKVHQINQHTTTSISISCTSHLKPGVHKPQARLWVWKTSFPNSRQWQVTQAAVCKTSV
jgi:hypothetical protein